MISLNFQKVNRKNFLIISVYFPFLLLFSLVVANRSKNFRDYLQYELLFENYNTLSIEPSYSFLSSVFSEYNEGFIYLLFVYAILGLSIKIILALKLLNKFKFLLFLILYTSAFLLLWDFIQIRTSVAMAFFLLAAFLDKRILKILFLIVSLLFHFSFFIPIGLYLYIYVLRNKYIALFSVFLVSLIFYLVNSYFNIFEKYSAENYGTNLSPLLLAKFLSCLYLAVLGFSNEYSNSNKNKFTFFYVGVGVLTFSLFLAPSFPQAAARYIDLSLFILCFSSLIYIKFRRNLETVIYMTWFFVFCFVNIWALYLNPKGLIFS